VVNEVCVKEAANAAKCLSDFSTSLDPKDLVKAQIWINRAVFSYNTMNCVGPSGEDGPGHIAPLDVNMAH